MKNRHLFSLVILFIFFQGLYAQKNITWGNNNDLKISFKGDYIGKVEILAFINGDDTEMKPFGYYEYYVEYKDKSVVFHKLYYNQDELCGYTPVEFFYENISTASVESPSIDFESTSMANGSYALFVKTFSTVYKKSYYKDGSSFSIEFNKEKPFELVLDDEAILKNVAETVLSKLKKVDGTTIEYAISNHPEDKKSFVGHYLSTCESSEYYLEANSNDVTIYVMAKEDNKKGIYRSVTSYVSPISDVCIEGESGTMVVIKGQFGSTLDHSVYGLIKIEQVIDTFEIKADYQVDISKVLPILSLYVKSCN